MSRGPDEGPAASDALELLERALAYTRAGLVEVRPDDLRRASPCRGWSLADLLAHMDDSLDAFLEAATGQVALVVPPVPPARPADAATVPVARLQAKACALLGAWTRLGGSARALRVGGLMIDSDVLVRAAALEIAVHGWDVARSLPRRAHAVPDTLARDLLPVADSLIDPTDRGVRFDASIAPSTGAGAATRLLAMTGRRAV